MPPSPRFVTPTTMPRRDEPLIQLSAKQNSGSDTAASPAASDSRGSPHHDRTPSTTPSESEPAPTHLASIINTVTPSPSSSQRRPTVIMWDLPCDDDGTDEPHFCTQYQCFRYKTDHLLHLELALSAELAEEYLEDEKTTDTPAKRIPYKNALRNTSKYYIPAMSSYLPGREFIPAWLGQQVS
ncbi:hypothetical protein ARMSODRAFT_1061497 [Armillaria solidipes]|uniref:Uncharacterized protein n=1 Tax=Armillaria solidipes TaxID=1076256 RepID=A0A2H3B064_9AGAR|nr:hypothetical protein ARMSODRAFT_1061497 [Armillaria solidipes]